MQMSDCLMLKFVYNKPIIVTLLTNLDQLIILIKISDASLKLHSLKKRNADLYEIVMCKTDLAKQ